MRQDPAKDFRQCVEYFGAALTAECLMDCKIIFLSPLNFKDMPEFWVDWHNLL